MANNHAQFETGAATAAANNLVLSVINNGEVYTARLHCGYAAFQGAESRPTIKDLVTTEANRQRKGGATFPSAAISEAVKIITADTRQHCLEAITSGYNPQRQIIATVRRWYDKVNGNSYFSASVTIPQGDEGTRAVNLPFEYGYGSYPQHAVDLLIKKLHLTPALEHGIAPVAIHDQGFMQKNRMYDGVYIA